MNYASLVFAVFTLLVTLLWWVWGRYHFHGPLVDRDNNERVDAIQLSTFDPRGNYVKLDEQKIQKLDMEEMRSDSLMDNSTSQADTTNSTPLIKGSEI